MSLVFAWGLGFLLRRVVWCTVFSGIQEVVKTKRSVSMLSISLLGPEPDDTPGHSLDVSYCSGRL